MKRSRLSIVTAVVFVFIVLLIVSLGRRESNDSIGQQVVDDDKTSAPTAITGENRAERLSRAIESTNVPIEFWGRVIDQDNSPVEGASVKLQVRRLGMRLDGTPGDLAETVTLLTNARGLVSMEEKSGYILSILDISKEGYRLASGQVRNFNFSTVGAVLPFSEKHPHQYIVIEEDEDLELFFAKHSLRPKWDGTPINLDLRTGETNAQSDLIISAVRGENHGRQFDWSISVTVPEGGIIETPRGNRALAPFDGYASEWSVDFKHDDQRFLSGLNVNAFIKTRAGLYARAQFDIAAHASREDVPSIHIRIFINEDGRRVLEDLTTNSRY